ncbi:hypothetical protein ON010_g2641 [Phytophthora cinnamomi]|nr:hypothetical protein ON010_g2641 [Phytophthora cinnamomi]
MATQLYPFRANGPDVGPTGAFGDGQLGDGELDAAELLRGVVRRGVRAAHGDLAQNCRPGATSEMTTADGVGSVSTFRMATGCLHRDAFIIAMDRQARQSTRHRIRSPSEPLSPELLFMWAETAISQSSRQQTLAKEPHQASEVPGSAIRTCIRALVLGLQHASALLTLNSMGIKACVKEVRWAKAYLLAGAFDRSLSDARAVIYLGHELRKRLAASRNRVFGDGVQDLDKLGVSMAELALAWCVSNENVSTVMIGAKTLAQLEQNLKAMEAVDKITPEVKAEIDALIPFVPELSKPDGTAAMRSQHL